MKNLRNDYCIRMFHAMNNLRPALSGVSLENGFLYSTDAHILAKISADKCVKKYEHRQNYPDADKVISDHVSAEKKTFSVDKLFHELMQIEVCFKPNMITCPNCKGEGDVECDCCNYTNECKDCKGSGEVSGPDLILSGESFCKIFKRKYKLSQIDKVLRTAIITGVDTIEISNGKTPASIFTVGDFKILVMITHE